jgi:hypothetical protein
MARKSQHSANDADFDPFGVVNEQKRVHYDRMFTFKSDSLQHDTSWKDPWNVDPWSGGDDLAPKLVDTSFDSSLEYSAESLFSDQPKAPLDDDPFDGQAFGDFKVFPTDAPSNLFPKKLPTIGVKVEERLSIFLEDTTSTPACRVIGSIFVSPSSSANTLQLKKNPNHPARSY